MSNMTVYQPAAGALIPFDEIQKMARAVAASGLFGIKNEAQAVALMLFAQSENLHPMTAVRDYHIMGGKPSMKSDTMLARFQSAGGKVQWERYDDQVVIGTFSHNNNSVKIEWTIERAKTIHQEVWEDGPNGRRKTCKPITDKEVWKYYPRNMLRARCTSEGIRAVMPGVLCGLYTPEEMQDISGIAIAETSGPDLPETPAYPDTIGAWTAKLDACQTVEECRLWLPAARQALHLKPGEPLYQELINAGKERADQIRSASQAEPIPELEPELEEVE